MPKNKKNHSKTVITPPSGKPAGRHRWLLLIGLLTLAATASWFIVQRADQSTPTAPAITVTGNADTASNPDSLASAASLVDEGQCQSCHSEQFKQWQGSPHQLAMQDASEQSVLGDFADVTFKTPQESTRFFRKGAQFWVNTVGADGRAADFKVAYAFGVEPLQQYLLETGGGHLQALGVAWDTQKKSWFHLYPGQGVDFKDPLHWSKPQQNANFMCIECHTTGFKRGFDAPTDTYSSHWQALGVGCQSCHGPASTHLAWSKQPDIQANAGFPSAASLQDGRREVETCARCHSRRAPLGDGFRAHKQLMDDYLPSALTPLLYEIDGKIKEEVFEYGSFVQSKMYAKGVSCSDCHNPHSNALHITGNGVCTQCHNPAGEAGRTGIDGRGLQAKDYDSPAHHQHAAGSAAAQCSSCHMPGKLYMVNDYRHDHSFSIPNPARALQFGTPDACLSCHQNTPGAKIVGQFQRWYGTPGPQAQRYDESLWLVRHGKPGAAQALYQQLASPELPAIRRATLLAELPNYPSQQAVQLAMTALHDPEPQVREAAVDSIGRLLPAQAEILGPLLDDPLLAVRIASVNTLLGLPAEQLGRYQSSWRKALDEYERVQLNLAERAEADLNLAMLYRADGRADWVEPTLRKALQRDSDFLPALVSLSQWLEDNARGDEARQLREDALRAHPDSALLQYNQGLALIRAGKHPPALQALREAARLEPDNGQYGYVLAIALHDSGQTAAARAQLAALLERQPGNRNARLALTGYFQEAGLAAEAAEQQRQLQAINPQDPALRGTGNDQ